MSEQSTAIKSEQQDTTVEQRLDDLERFIARRFDEISMEIEATSQLMEMAEEDAGKRFTDMLAMLNAISFTGDGSSPANSGAELEAVVKETEKAANTIMDAADNIKTVLEQYDDELSSDMRLATMSETIFTNVQNILMACEFQDLVSQRVTTSLKNIRDIEERLSKTLEKFGVDTSQARETAISSSPAASDVASQDDIDALFN